MDILNQVAAFLANQWVGWALTILFAAASVFLKFRIDSIKAIAEEVLDIAKVHRDATDPKSENGELYSDSERAKLDAEFKELLGDLAVAIGRGRPVE